MTGNDVLEFDLGQKWAKGLCLRFNNAAQSAALNLQEGFILKQVHSNKLIEWKSSASFESLSQIEADGFVARGESFRSSKKKLIIRSADCAPLFYVDRESECLAALHAGWKGLAKGIHKVPFEKEGFNPKTTWIWCGPCLNGENFEVGADMWSQFPKDVQNNSEIFSETSKTGLKANTGKKFFYSWNFLASEFKKIGVELFYNVEIDTFSDTSFNSYRRWKKMGEPEKLPHNYSWIAFK